MMRIGLGAFKLTYHLQLPVEPCRSATWAAVSGKDQGYQYQQLTASPTIGGDQGANWSYLTTLDLMLHVGAEAKDKWVLQD